MYFLSDLNISNRNNNLTIIRTLAAISVVFGHAFILDDGKDEFLFGAINTGYFGLIAVAVFFALSGFLITQSFLRSKSVADYLEARVLRIFPGLFYSAVMTILAIYIFGKTTPSSYASVQYFLKTITLKSDLYHDYFISNPINGANGSLWTLETEFKYYIVILFLGLAGFFKHRWLLLSAAVAATALYLNDNIIGKFIFAKVLNTPADAISAYLNLPLCFFAGVFAFLFRKRVPISIVLAIAVFGIGVYCGNWVTYALAWSYVSFVIGFHPRLFSPKLIKMDDLSYGIYITSYPIQQLLVMNFPQLKAWGLFAVSLPLTLLASYFSWVYVEKKALEYRGHFFKGIASKFRQIKCRFAGKNNGASQ